MSFRTDLGEVTEALAVQGRRVLVAAILAEAEVARDAIVIAAPSVQQARQTLDTIRAYVEGRATEEDCERQRTFLTTSAEFSQAAHNVETQEGLYRYQKACAALAMLATNGYSLNAIWAIEDLVEFWHAWTKPAKAVTQRGMLRRLHACLDAALQDAALQNAAPPALPIEAIEARLRPSTLASRTYSLC